MPCPESVRHTEPVILYILDQLVASLDVVLLWILPDCDLELVQQDQAEDCV